MAQRRPRILLATTSPLLPADSGGRIYTWRLAELLADRVDFHLLAMATDDERAELDRGGTRLLDEYHTVFRSVHVVDRPPLPAQLGRAGVARHLAFHARHGLPLMDVSSYTHEAVAVGRRLATAGAVDLLEVDHLHMAFMRRFVPEVPAVLVNHNIEGDLYPFWPTTRWSGPELAAWKAFGRLSRRNAHRIEIGNAFGFAAKVFISPVDAARVDDSVPKRVVPLPAAPEGGARHFDDDGPARVLWLGGFDWPPNAEAARWLGAEVWPLVREKAAPGSIELHLIGRDPPAGLAALLPDATFHGYVDDVDEWRAGADALAVPIRSGSGVRVKVIEALASGLPVVTTPKGCEGLPLQPGRDALIAAEPAAFADALVRLARSPELRRSLSRAGRDYVAANHDPARVAAAKLAVYDQVLGSV